MTILITGGTGKTGLALSRLLYAANYPILIASRAGKAPEPFKAVTFNWLDESTFDNAFNADANIDRVYIIVPDVLDPMPVVKPFIDLAISKSVKRFVLLGGTDGEVGDPGIGKIYKYLLDVGIDYAILRPTWFIENFSTQFYYSIRENNEVCSAAKDGRIPFVSVNDIAQTAFESLTAEQSPNKDYFVVGPELHSYDEAVQILSTVIGRKITHRRVTVEDQQKTLVQIGLSPDYATFLANLELKVVNGSEVGYFNAPADRKFVGKHTLREHFEGNRALWIK